MGGRTIGCLVGPPGSGTTTSARAEATEARRHGRPVHWVRGSSEAALQVDFLTADRDEADNDRRALIVIDDLASELVDADLLGAYLADWPGAEVLVTTVSGEARRLGPVRRVAPLGGRAVEALLAEYLGRGLARRVAPALAERFDGRPLGLHLAGATLASMGGGGRRADTPVRHYLDRIVEAPAPLVTAVEAALVHLGGPDSGSGRLLAALAVLGDTTVPVGPPTVVGADGGALAALAASGLVERRAGCVRMSPAIRSTLRTAPSSPGVTEGAVEDAAALLSGLTGVDSLSGRDRLRAGGVFSQSGGSSSTFGLDGALAPAGARGWPASGDLRSWLPALHGLAAAVADCRRPCPRARRLLEVALEHLAGELPVELLLPLQEARARLAGIGLAAGDVAAWSVRRDLASARVNSGRPEPAVADFAALVAETEAALGPAHPDALLARCGLGVALLETGRVTRSLAELDPVVDGLVAACGPDDPATRRAVRHRAAALVAAGRADDAVADLVALRSAGPSPSESAGTGAVEPPPGRRPGGDDGDDGDDEDAVRRELAVALLAAGRPEAALAELDSLLRTLGADSARTDALDALVTQRLRASALLRAGRVDEAVGALGSVARRLDRHGPRSPAALAAWSELVVAYDAADRAPAAAALADRLLGRCRQALGAGHPLTLGAAARSGAAQLHRQDAGAAARLLGPLVDEALAADPDPRPGGPLAEVRELLARALGAAADGGTSISLAAR